jgi:hypothetical protein
MAADRRGAGLYRNTVSYFGGLLAAFSAALIVATLLWGLGLKQPSPYLGIFTYMIFPAFLSLGGLLFLYGMRRESLRRRKAGSDAALPYPSLDLNDPVQRKRFGVLMVGGSLLAILMAFVGYNAFIFTESVTFCGKVCHTVMEPEHTAYLNSPHARVRCVDCHVGSGAQWYVKSKMSGLYQVYAVLTHSYETPIPTPVSNLRPARETCEECHWPAKFYGAQLLQIPHFRYDEKNTPEQVSLLVKTGGGSTNVGENAGIHWHMILNVKITFAALDERQQVIPWVEVQRADGSSDVYVNHEQDLGGKTLASLPRHEMDCIDCHNRPTHIYPAPESGIDRALAGGLVDPSLPWIKKVAVDAVVREYPDHASAREGIRKEILAYYETNYPDVAKTKGPAISAAADAAYALYARSVFPAMKVNWRTYPNNIGHRNWPGCFRCHDGRHVSETGKALTMECTVCHTMPQRGPLTPLGTVMPASAQPWHPFELAGKHATILCNRCHAAGYRPPTDCAECHKMDVKAPMMAMGCDGCHTAKPGQKLPVAECRSCHDSLKGLHLKGGHPDASCTDCHAPHAWKVTGRATCETCHDDKKAHYKDDGACADCHDFKAS